MQALPQALALVLLALVPLALVPLAHLRCLQTCRTAIPPPRAQVAQLPLLRTRKTSSIAAFVAHIGVVVLLCPRVDPLAALKVGAGLLSASHLVSQAEATLHHPYTGLTTSAGAHLALTNSDLTSLRYPPNQATLGVLPEDWPHLSESALLLASAAANLLGTLLCAVPLRVPLQALLVASTPIGGLQAASPHLSHWTVSRYSDKGSTTFVEVHLPTANND